MSREAAATGRSVRPSVMPSCTGICDQEYRQRFLASKRVCIVGSQLSKWATSATVGVRLSLWSQTSPILNYGPSFTDKEKSLSGAYNAQVSLATGGWRLPGEWRWCRQGRCPANQSATGEVTGVTGHRGEGLASELPPSTPPHLGRSKTAPASRAAQSRAPARPSSTAPGAGRFQACCPGALASPTSLLQQAHLCLAPSHPPATIALRPLLLLLLSCLHRTFYPDVHRHQIQTNSNTTSYLATQT